MGCGGVLIDSMYVLTAAECVANPTGITVYLSSGDKTNPGTARAAAQVTPHPSYASGTNPNENLALVRLNATVPLGTGRGLACLPRTPIRGGKECWVTGWGHMSNTSVNSLQAAPITVGTKSKCTAFYGTNFKGPSMICGNGRTSSGAVTDACQGDKGGPLVCADADGKYYVQGIVSWNQCGSQYYPSVFAATAHNVNWMKTTMR